VRRKAVFTSVAGVAFLVIIVVFLFLPRVGMDDVRSSILYNIGDEVSDYPIASVYANFTAYKITKQFHEYRFLIDAQEGSSIVVFNFTIRNTLNKTIILVDELLKHPVQMPTIIYRLSNEDGTNSSYTAGVVAEYSIRWIHCLLIDDLVRSNGLMRANQTANGIFIFTIPELGQVIGLHLKTAQANEDGIGLAITPSPKRELN
jgi:hypothetical protein